MLTRNLLRLGDTLSDAARSAWGERFDALARRLEDAIADAHRRAEEARESPDFTAQGRGNRLRELGIGAQRTLTRTAAELRRLVEDAERRLRDRIPSGPVELADLGDFSAAPVRQFDNANLVALWRTELLASEPVAVRATLEQEARTGAAIPLYAAQTLPAHRRRALGLDDRALDELRREFRRARDPSAFESLAAVEEVSLALAHNLRASRRAVGASTGVETDPDADVVARAARGGAA